MNPSYLACACGRSYLYTGERFAIISERNVLPLIDLTIPLEKLYQIFQSQQKMSLKCFLYWPYLPIL